MPRLPGGTLYSPSSGPGDAGPRLSADGETLEIPSFYVELVKRDLGSLWPMLPEGALSHDPYAYLKKSSEAPAAIEFIEETVEEVGAAQAAD